MISIEQLKNNNLTVLLFPQPATDEVTVQFNVVQNKIAIELYNALGSLILKQNSTNSNNVSLKLNGLAAGIYSVMITTEKGRVVKKLIIN